MRALISGGSGFIGSKLGLLLKAKGFHIINIDKKGPNELFDENYQIDISSSDFSQQNFGDLDYIFHLAAQSGGYYSLNNSYDDVMWNAVGTLNMVKLAQREKVKKFIYTSSMAVYGNIENASELTTPLPISFYGVSKLTGEYYTQLLKEHSSIDYTIFRLFATYGSGQDLNNKHQGILSIYLEQALNSNTINITGVKSRVRELVHVDDVISAIYLAIHNKETDNEIFNVTHKERLTPEKIIKELSSQLNKKLIINELDGYLGDQTIITGNSDKLAKIGWRAQKDLKVGIEEFLRNLK
jgi:UDP-glucose 4-epimerase